MSRNIVIFWENMHQASATNKTRWHANEQQIVVWRRLGAVWGGSWSPAPSGGNAKQQSSPKGQLIVTECHPPKLQQHQGGPDEARVAQKSCGRHQRQRPAERVVHAADRCRQQREKGQLGLRLVPSVARDREQVCRVPSRERPQPPARRGVESRGVWGGVQKW